MDNFSVTTRKELYRFFNNQTLLKLCVSCVIMCMKIGQFTSTFIHFLFTNEQQEKKLYINYALDFLCFLICLCVKIIFKIYLADLTYLTIM